MTCDFKSSYTLHTISIMSGLWDGDNERLSAVVSLIMGA